MKIVSTIPGELPKTPIPKVKYQSLLHAIGDGWYMKKLSENIPPQNRSKLIKKAQ